MAKSRSSRSSNRRGRNLGPLLLGMVLGAALLTVAIVAYFYFGRPPVAVNDAAAIWEPLVQRVPLQARAKASSKQPPFPASEDVFEAAARTYSARCAECHGTPGHESRTGLSMTPHAPQFFSARDKKTTSATPTGELYWTTAYGARRTGMPAYRGTLSDTQMWQLALLLHSAADELPDPVHALLTANNPAPQPTEVKP